ncbi:ABC transporter ATP-binding protein [Thermodesulfomicrobium sp. WS]|uniref:ABC transporter ATP-binding protein n=1 Tax=Thermodesulfomicrobium sp. WS TaxID=3004129 RepID=UPI0024906D1F|nr:ABC transporter ATP-binding protein [Thermodesulfomicrobium sp. WS]BDV00981.1 ABC transporter ATP-binding protein [Thermodesulfomicrobium sp. WS]
MKPLLWAEDLAHGYGDRWVFQGVGVRVCAGEVLLVVGPNGAGKSTLLALLAGLMAPRHGVVHSQVGPEAMAMMGHGTYVYGSLTALENLRFWARLYGLPADESTLEAVLGRVGLAQWAMEPAGTFSRGMAQRLSLARVILLAPRLVFLDEPATGLDMASVALLHREIQSLRQSGAAVVWVSHDVARDLPLATSVLHLRGGRVHYLGPAGDFAGESVC